MKINSNLKNHTEIQLLNPKNKYVYKNNPRRYKKVNREQVIDLLNKGLGKTEIANLFGVTRFAIYRIIERSSKGELIAYFELQDYLKQKGGKTRKNVFDFFDMKEVGYD